LITIALKMETECLYMLKIIRKLQDPVSQYVLGCLPAIATIGIAPWSDKKSLCIYWLSSDHFIRTCVTKASVLERLSSLASLYYILIGIVSGISRVVRPTICDEDWLCIPLALS
ncbi:6977_t:CDS:2, partial [Funneliformis mosseae]